MRLPKLVPLVCLLLGFAPGCATVASGNYGRPIDADGKLASSRRTPAGLEISARELRSMASAHFGCVEVTIENKTDEWVRIERIGLGFGSAQRDQRVFIPWGRELVSWELAIAERNAVRRANTDTALMLTAAGGGALAAAGESRGARAAGGLIALGALSTAFATDIDRRASGATDIRPFPEAHLLDVPIAVPPGLFSSRFIVLNTQSSAPCVHSMVLDYDTAKGQRERVLVQFRRKSSEWQRGVCDLGSGRARR